MRPDINHSQSIKTSLLYNERKLSQKQAECILAANFLKDVDKLSYDDKLHRFKRRMELNDDVSTSYHISLNFDPSDNLSHKELQDIARLYMKELGFERQPYLVYKHNDAGHPHLHIVTTHVQSNGDPIDMYKIGENQSEKARQYIEQKYNLATSEKKKLRQTQTQKIEGIQMIIYGEKSTARAVSDVVQFVTEKYNYTSLEELNAVLRLYNVEAYRGREDSKLYQNHGLLYRVLDEHGRYIGVPLKASFFDFKPTLTNLEKKFVLNLSQRERQTKRLTATVMWVLVDQNTTLKQVQDKLARDRIYMYYRLDSDKKITDLTYIDFETKSVFNSSSLDEHCSIQAIQQVIEREQTLRLQQTLEEKLEHTQRHRLRHYL